MSVDTKNWSCAMLKLFRKTRELTVDFCEGCSRVCDADSRRAAVRERALQAWRYGTRI